MTDADKSGVGETFQMPRGIRIDCLALFVCVADAAKTYLAALDEPPVDGGIARSITLRNLRDLVADLELAGGFRDPA